MSPAETGHKLLAILDAPGAGNWQGAVENRATHEWFLCEGKKVGTREDSIFYHFAPDLVNDPAVPKPDTAMIGRDLGHQTSFSVSDTNVLWLADNGDLVTKSYEPGKTVTRSATSVMKSPVAGSTRQISLSPTRKYACIRRVQTATETYSRWEKDSNGKFVRQLGKTITVKRSDDRVVQGFGLESDECRVLTGHSNGPSYVERYSFKTGKSLGRLDLLPILAAVMKAAGISLVGMKIEAEGLDGDRVGFKIGQGDIRKLYVIQVVFP